MEKLNYSDKGLRWYDFELNEIAEVMVLSLADCVTYEEIEDLYRLGFCLQEISSAEYLDLDYIKGTYFKK